MHIVTVVNGIGETSMPYNEFVLYNLKYKPEIKQTLIICMNNTLKSEIPDGINVINTGMNPFKIRKAVKQILKESADSGEQVVFHMHQAASAAALMLATLGLNVRSHSLFSMHTQYHALDTKNRILNRIAISLSGRTVFVSTAAHDAYPEKVRAKKGADMTTITNGVDAKRIELALVGESKPSNDMIELAYVARIIPLKNHEFLLRVIQRVDNVKLLLIGADKHGDFTEKVKSAGLTDRVEMTGLMPRDEVFRRIYHSDIYVSSSTIEGMPISVLEAMCCKLPVILSDIPPHTQITEKGDFGVSLPFDEDKWVEALERMTNMSSDERVELGERARECAIANFSLNSMHTKYYEIYNIIAR